MFRFNQRLVVLVLIVFLLPLAAHSQHFQYTRTDNNHSIVVNEALLNDNPLQENDEIGVFDPDGVCAGACVVEEVGERMGIAAWGDDLQTDFDEGFEDGDPFLFLFWDNDQEREWDTEFEVVDGQGRWIRNGFSVVNLRSGGVPPDPRVPDEHDFGRVVVDESLLWELAIENEGEFDLVIDRAEIEGDDFRVEMDEEGLVIESNEEGIINVLFEPEQRGECDATLTFRTNAEIGQIEILLHGIGVLPPRMGLNHDEVDFGRISIIPDNYGSPYIGWDTLQVSNEGDIDLMLTGFSLGMPDYFMLPEDFPDTLTVLPAEMEYIILSFDPETLGTYESIFTFFTNDPENNTVVIPLTGVGINPGIWVPEQDESPFVNEFRIQGISPNPFNNTVKIRFNISQPRSVNAVIYDVFGREVAVLANNRFIEGEHHLTWNGRNSHGLPVRSGLYVIRITTDRYKQTAKMLLLK